MGSRLLAFTRNFSTPKFKLLKNLQDTSYTHGWDSGFCLARIAENLPLFTHFTFHCLLLLLHTRQNFDIN